jgi:hypothetical protein
LLPGVVEGINPVVLTPAFGETLFKSKGYSLNIIKTIVTIASTKKVLDSRRELEMVGHPLAVRDRAVIP